MMRSGEMDRRVQVQEASVARGPSGEEMLTWSTVRTVAAKVERGGGSRPGTGGESEAAQEEKGLQRITVTCRWFSGASTKQRLVFEGRDWDIQSTAEIGRREGLEITAEARSE